MCLYSAKKDPTIAPTDITCYKILLQVDDNYITPFRLMQVELDSCVTAKGDKSVTKAKSEASYSVTSGYIHAYVSKELALRNLRLLKKKRTASMVVVEAIIPEGSSYYKSVGNIGICSDKMYLTNKLICNV